MSVPSCSVRFLNWVTSSPVPSQAPPAAAENWVVIAPNPTIPGMVRIFNSPRRDGKTVTQNLPSSAAVRKAETEIAQYRKFRALADELVDELVDVNRKICRLRPVEPMEQTWRSWRSALIMVKPETVIGWHRKGFRLFWTWESRHGRRGRPSVVAETRELIRQMSRDNPLWGAPPIHGELLKLGIDIGETSVSKCASSEDWHVQWEAGD
jgi:hypothetical protein